ncbi:hypothetical protein [Cryobacterium sp. TMT1-66-1]|uniref:hypothetical protein n=1 Tax=Cryobacterium sp. TMT1-66-1 TaxID=1259242 RepID=UPI001F53FF4B|nr:hypothetical protein [Cryobacterium sp. TMT1-66-1]
MSTAENWPVRPMTARTPSWSRTSNVDISPLGTGPHRNGLLRCLRSALADELIAHVAIFRRQVEPGRHARLDADGDLAESALDLHGTA